MYKLGAKGVMRRQNDKVAVGDFVEFDKDVVTKLLPRKNYFPRPNVANIDVVVIVVSPVPKPDYTLVDKLVINALSGGLDIVFAVNKSDVSNDLFEKIKTEYASLDAKFINISATEKSGVADFFEIIQGKLVLFAGQSAVGKTSLVNALFDTNLKTGNISEKIGRGKHTTTASSIHEYNGTRIIDTPGFAVIDAFVKSEDLAEYYPEYYELANGCKFRGCKHISEPDCAVKNAVEQGVLSKKRYDRYLEIYNEILEKEKYNEEY